MTIDKLTTPFEVLNTKYPSKKSESEPNTLNHDNEGTKRYDFQNISRTEFRAIINDLIKTDQISLDESSSLLMAMDSGNISEDFSQNSEQKVNVFEILKQSMEFNRYIGNVSGIEYDTKAINTLLRLESKPITLRTYA